MKMLFRYFRQALTWQPKLFVCAMMLALTMTAMDSLMPWALRKFLVELTTYNSYLFLLTGILLFAIYIFFKIYIKTQWYLSLDRFGGKYIESLSIELEHLLAQADYFSVEEIQPAVIRNILFTDILNICRVIGHHIPSILNAVTVILVSIIVSATYDSKLTIFIFLVAIVGLLMSWGSRKILAHTAGQTNAKLKQYDSWCTQFVDLLPLIQNHNLSEYFEEQTSKNMQEFIDTSIEEDRRSVFIQGLTHGYHSLFSITLSAILAIPIAGSSIPNLVFFTMIADIIMEQMLTVETLFQQTMRLYVSFHHIDRLQHLPRRSGKKKIGIIDKIEFSSVNFLYPDGTVALKNISCNMKRGDIIRLEGANGSGKSTFIKLLTGLYSNQSGCIKINDNTLEIYSKSSLNEQILYIDQDELCLNEKFFPYLELVSSKDISQARYSTLLNCVNLIDEGKIIANNGKSLSGGQRKKLLLMKFLLLADSVSLIIIDELTAGMDTETIELFYSCLRQIACKKDKIILIVDHNLKNDTFCTKRYHFLEGSLIIETV